MCVCVQRDNHQYPKLDFTRDELQERFKFQLSIEKACTVTIDSVEAAKPVTENMAKMVSHPGYLIFILSPQIYSGELELTKQTQKMGLNRFKL